MKICLKLKKILAFAVLSIIISAGSSYAFSLGDLGNLLNPKLSDETGNSSTAKPEDALSTRPDDSVYIVLKLDNTARFLKWILSKENINIFMPLILGSRESQQIIGGIEIISAIIENTPLRSAALTIGIDKSGIKLGLPFFQMAFTVHPSVASIVQKIAQGNASAADIARLILGADNPLASFAETMIKVQREDDNILRVDNEIFMKAQDGLIMLGTSLKEVRSAAEAFNDAKARLFEKFTRRFDKKDFALIHCDYNIAAELDDDTLEKLNAQELFDKPLDIELAFERLKDKFSVSTGLNLNKSLKKKYAAQINSDKIKPVKGGNIALENSGGDSAPLASFGTYTDFSVLTDNPEMKSFFNRTLRQLRRRFGITEEDVKGVFRGPFSAVVNGNVQIEGFKIPAVYFSQTGKKGAASKLYSKLQKSPHFQKVQEGILQIDSSLSPISCLVENRGDTLGVSFAELSSLSEKPKLKPALADLMNKTAISAFWVDFAGIQAWFNDDENGLLAMAAPVAKLMGYGKYIDALREILEAELSVPSVSVWVEDPEVFHTDFAIAEINPNNGIAAKLVKIYREFKK